MVKVFTYFVQVDFSTDIKRFKVMSESVKSCVHIKIIELTIIGINLNFTLNFDMLLSKLDYFHNIVHVPGFYSLSIHGLIFLCL